MTAFTWLLLMLPVMACALCGPAALIVAIVAMKKAGDLQREMHALAARQAQKPAEAAPAVVREIARPVTPARVEPTVRTEPAATPVQAPTTRMEPQPWQAPAARAEPQVVSAPAARVEPQAVPVPQAEAGLEQRIGTRWVLIAGVVTVMFAVGFFLKYAYDQRWIGPWGRVLIAGFSGLVALAIGEVTRRRGYDIVAKGVTALGFAILYATVFAAHRGYHLIGSPTAYVLSIMVTAGAMVYAVALDEIIIAVLSLVGGFLTPVVLSTGQNTPTLLFSYILILIAGAMFCTYWRRWVAVNVLVFLGTYLLYAGWFERFYRPAMKAESPPAQLGVALFWLAVFFAIYLVLPILHALVRRVKSVVQDVVLVLVNAAVVFYYLWTILHEYRAALALCSLGLGVAHLLLASVVLVRCRDDAALRRCLLIAALVFATLAVPLYFRMYAVAILWAVEGLLVTAAGLRYRSAVTQLAGGLALALAFGDLLTELPLHTDSFRLFFNPAFGTWCFVAAAVMICHGLYRVDKHLDANLRSASSQGFYVAGLGVLMLAVAMELWCHHGLNPPAGKDRTFFWEQMVLVFAAFIPLFVARPICPRGQAARVAGTMLAGAGAIYVLAALPMIHGRAFTIFVNGGFARAILLVAVLFASAWLLRRTERREPDEFVAAAFVAVGAVIVLWILMTEEIWLYYDDLRPSAQWQFLARMYIAVLWAAYATVLMVIGLWRRVRLLPYLALGILALAVGNLLTALPMHTQSFSPLFNAAFAAWCCVAAAMIACHALYRFDKHLDANLRSAISQGLYVAGFVLLMAAITMELWWHQQFNLSALAGGPFFWRQMTLVFAAFILVFVTRPICPRGQACRVAWALLAIAAPICLLTTLPSMHGSSFTMFLNADFARALLLVAMLFASAWLSRRTERREPDQLLAARPVALGVIILLWLLLTEEIWLYYDRLRPSQWRFLMQMYISILWAAYATVLMVVGFWRRVRVLRYIALGIFLLLLAKIFIVDTQQLETAYRIAGFLATGLALVAVSYLYQYLKKTGFFETARAERDPPDREQRDA